LPVSFSTKTPIDVGQGCNTLCRSLKDRIRDYLGTNFTDALIMAGRYLSDIPIKTKPTGIISKILTGIFEVSGEDSEPSMVSESCNNNTHRIIMLTDGRHNCGGSPVDIAEQVKDTGVIIECVGIAGKSRQVDEKMLKKISSLDENNKPRYCFIDDTEKLIKKYKSMAHHIRPA